MIKDSNRLQGKTLAEVLEPAGNGGTGAMLKSVYDPDDDGIIAVEQTEANKYPDTGEQAFRAADRDKLDSIGANAGRAGCNEPDVDRKGLKRAMPRNDIELWRILRKSDDVDAMIYHPRMSKAQVMDILKRDYELSPAFMKRLEGLGKAMKKDALETLWTLHKAVFAAGVVRHKDIAKAVNAMIMRKTGKRALMIPASTLKAAIEDNNLLDWRPKSPERTARDERKKLEGLHKDVPTFANTSRGETIKTVRIIEEELEAGDYTVDSIAKRIADETGIEFEQARIIVRTESTGISNNLRDRRYRERDPEGNFRYGWIGADDFRTTDICKNIKSRIAKEGHGKGVSLKRLHEIVKEESIKGNGKGWKYRSLLPHPNCRHSLVRIV